MSKWRCSQTTSGWPPYEKRHLKVIFNSVITYLFCRTSFHLLCRILRTQQMSSFSVFHFILIAQAHVLFTMQYSHCTEYGNNDFHDEIHHSWLKIYFWNATFRQGGGIPFSFGIDIWGRQQSGTHFTGWWHFQNLSYPSFVIFSCRDNSCTD